MAPKMEPEVTKTSSRSHSGRVQKKTQRKHANGPKMTSKRPPQGPQNGAKIRPKWEFGHKMVRKWGVEIPGVLRRPKMDSKIILKNDQKTIKNHDQNSKKYGGLCQKAPETNAERSPLTVGTQQG